MAKLDGESNIKVLNAIDIQAITTDTTTAGDILDTQGYESVTFVFQAGTLTDGDYTPLIREGDDSGLSDASEVSDLRLLPSGTGQEASAALSTSNGVSKIGVTSNKRYIEASLVSANTSSGGTLGAIALLGHPNNAPVA